MSRPENYRLKLNASDFGIPQRSTVADIEVQILEIPTYKEMLQFIDPPVNFLLKLKVIV